MTEKWKNTGIRRLVLATTYSWAGLRAAWKNEAAFRQEVLALLITVPLGCWLGENGIERALLLGSLFIVLITELVNSALEAVVDRHGPEFHELAGRAKDMGSAAVFIALVNVAVIWFFVLFN